MTTFKPQTNANVNTAIAADPAATRAAMGVGRVPLATMTRDDQGRVESATVAGETLAVTRDSNGLISSVLKAGATTRTINRDAYGRVTSVT